MAYHHHIHHNHHHHHSYNNNLANPSNPLSPLNPIHHRHHKENCDTVTYTEVDASNNSSMKDGTNYVNGGILIAFIILLVILFSFHKKS